MHVFLSSLKYKPPSLMFHHHKVFLFAIQCLFCFLDALAHSCASLPLRYKCNAYLGLFAMITTFDVIKLDHTPECGVAWFIIKELKKSFISWILSIIVLWLVVCILPITIKRFSSIDLVLDCQSTCLQLKHTFHVYVIINLHGTIKLFGHASHSLQYKVHCCMLSIILNEFLSTRLIKL
jgi:hypothetical protein